MKIRLKKLKKTNNIYIYKEKYATIKIFLCSILNQIKFQKISLNKCTRSLLFFTKEFRPDISSKIIWQRKVKRYFYHVRTINVGKVHLQALYTRFLYSDETTPQLKKIWYKISLTPLLITYFILLAKCVALPWIFVCLFGQILERM